MSDDEGGLQTAQDWSFHDAPSPAESLKSETEVDERMPGADAAAPSQPIQKRRRVTRACDECRRKKIKCDGKQPCTHCSVYSYDCTYDKPSNRRRNPAPQYIEALENRLQRAEMLLRKFMPDVDLADPNLDPSIQQEFHNREQARLQAARNRAPQAPDTDSSDAHILSMIDSIGQLDIDEKGGWDFRGTSSGTVFLRRMREHFRGMLGPFAKPPFLPRLDRMAGLLGGQSSFDSTPFTPVYNPPELPPKDVARKLCYYSLSCATCLVRIVHVPSFYEHFDAIYAKPLHNLDEDDTDFLSLFFAVLALGCMYNYLDETAAGTATYRLAIDQGVKYYKISKTLLRDMTECRSLASIQALLYMILFLQSTASPSTCYSILGIALRSALRIGLHRDLQHEKISDVEQQVRRRVFYVIRQLDIYVSSILGFPLLMSSEDIDQQYPIEVDDEYITQAGILQPPPGSPSIFQAFNAHTRLMEILGKIVKYVYPTKCVGPGTMRENNSPSAHSISYSRIKEIETDLHNCRVDELSYACAAAAISVSRNIIHIGLEIRKQRVLSGTYWFMLYTEFFSVLSLVFYAIENPEKPGSAEVLADAHAGRAMIAELSEKSLSAERVTQALRPLFDQLSEGFNADATQPWPMNLKKRTAPSGKGAQNVTGSVESMQRRSKEQPFPEAVFPGSMHDLMPMDLSSRATPDSTSTGESSYRQRQQAHQVEDTDHVHRLEALMFPSDDPFAYPNQPMTELGFSMKTDVPLMTMPPQVTDSNFFFPTSLEDFGTDSFLGQPPPYMMQQQQNPLAMSFSGSIRSNNNNNNHNNHNNNNNHRSSNNNNNSSSSSNINSNNSNSSSNLREEADSPSTGECARSDSKNSG
ncbi:Activator of stress protein 1 [Escovopsis weberi]|uniref:Activator of stress protein 1 n=1 Tax=Escovopsis weberi TaxID=150374 RepID=A0A0M8MRJ8_ESCWE|nr:Activator of stress protein 1 [Escovopsis weberi]